MFVRTRRGIIPMIEMGDNNVWDCDGRKRSRTWEGIQLIGRKKFYTHDEIFNAIEQWNTSYKEKLTRDLALMMNGENPEVPLVFMKHLPYMENTPPVLHSLM